MADLIITNGDSAGDSLKQAFPGATVLPWRDVLHEGPVPLTQTAAELSQVRAQYLNRQWAADAAADFDERAVMLDKVSDFERVGLWFEHDLYDQLQLLQILDALAATPLENLELIQADDYLGHYGPDDIGAWRNRARPVSQAQIDVAVRAWRAFRQDTPQAWFALLSDDLSPLPHLKAAVIRMLEELPDHATGLSRTERHILQAAHAGHVKPGKMFGACQTYEEAQFLGDWSFFDRLDGLVHANKPLLSTDGDVRFVPNAGDEGLQTYLRAEFHLTDWGQKVFDEQENHARHNTIDFWWGGTHVRNDTLWCWDRGQEKLISPGVSAPV